MDRILWNKRDEDIDEIVMTNVGLVHIEQMDDRCWWIALYRDGQAASSPFWMGNFRCDSRGNMWFYETDNYRIVWDRDEEHA